MRLIIDGEYNKDLVKLIGKQKFPISHVIVHVPQNSMGNGSIFLPKKKNKLNKRGRKIFN